MKQYLFISLLLIIFGTCVQGKDITIEDLVNPKTWDDGFPYDGEWFSGYLNATEAGDQPNMKIHYFFFPSDLKQKDEAPVLIWLTSGPKPTCSSLQAALQENGPFTFDFQTTLLKKNTLRWTRLAHVLYLEVPPGVGFSKQAKVVWNDTEIAEATKWSIIDFFINKFELYKKNDIFIGGTGFGAGYALAAEKLLDDWNGGLPKFNVEGLLIGNPAVMDEQCDNIRYKYNPYLYEFLYRRGFISDENQQLIDQYCQDWTKVIDVCKDTLDKINDSITDMNPYNYQMDCPQGNDPKCWDSIGVKSFLNDEKVQVGIHVDKQQWNPCADDSKVKYQFTMAPFKYFDDLIYRQQRLWIYSGDLDSKFSMFGTLQWIQILRQKFGLADIDPWRGWYSGSEKERQHAGSIWRMDNIVFISVHGTGHRVVRDNPHAGFYLLQAFLDDGDLR